MKHLKLFFALFAMLALGVGNAWGATYSLTPDKNGTGLSNTAYITSLTEFTNNGISWKMNQWNPSTLQIKTNQSTAANEWRFYNTSAIPGKITKVVIKFSALTLKNTSATGFKFVGGSSAVTETTGGTDGVWDTSAKTLTWTPSASDNFTYFALYQNGKVASGTNKLATSDAIVVTYEASGSTEPVLSVTPTEVDFGTVYQGATVEAKTVAVNFSNLTGAVTYNGLEATPFTATGSISATGDKITIAADASTIDEYSQTLTVVSAADNKTAEVTVTMKVVEAPAPTGTFELYSGELTEGDYVIYYNGSAMKAEVASSRLSYVEVAPADNKIENPDAATIWHIAQSGTNWTIYNNDKGYAAGTGTANKAQLLSQEDITTSASASDNLKKASWTVTGTETYDFVNVFNSTKDSPVNATLRNNVNGGTNYGFACYATNTGGALTLYKKSDGKQPAGLVYETNKYRTKLGDSFVTPTLTNPNSLNVTYSSSNNDVAEVATDGSVTIKAVGGVEITATFAGSETHRQGSAKYTICVTEHAGTQADPYSVADARRVIDVMETAEGVYATGIVSEIVTAYNSTYGNISYNISADGLTTSNQLQAYRGKSYDGANFTSADDVKVGDEVVIKGTLKKYSTTYEFDENNQLVSLNRTKEQAGLVYAVTELAAEVGATEFAEPELTNPNGLSVEYSTSDATLATVNATTGEVTIGNKAGTVTITASFAGDENYVAGEASYTINITDPNVSEATFVAGTDISEELYIYKDGITVAFTGGVFNRTDNYRCYGNQSMTISYNDGTITKIVIECTANDGAEYGPGQFTTETATYSYSGKVGTWTGEAKSVTFASTKQVRMTQITVYYKQDKRSNAELAWSEESVSLTVGDAFTAPTFNNPNSVAPISFKSDNTNLATVNNAGVISLVNGKTGTATITATYAGNETYKAAEVTCVITVSPKSEKVVILAQLEGQWYAMTGAYVTDKTNVLAAIPVEYINGKLYNVAETDKASIEWQRSMNGNKATFKNGDNYLTGGTSGTDLTLKTIEFEWDYNGVNYLSGNETTKRTFLYCENTKNNVYGFKNFAISNAGSVKNNSDGTTESYSSTPEVVAPVYATATIYTREDLTVDNHGTICLPYGSSNYSGAEFYEVSSLEVGKGLWLDQLAAGASLEAGKPYIFKATAAKIAVAYEGAKQESPVAGVNGLTGTFTDIEANDVLVGNYIIAENQIWVAGEGATLPANRAYINATLVPKKVQPEIPGRRRVCMGENAATGFDNIVAPEGQAVKVIENGQLIIIRDGVKYNVQGQKL